MAKRRNFNFLNHFDPSIKGQVAKHNSIIIGVPVLIRLYLVTIGTSRGIVFFVNGVVFCLANLVTRTVKRIVSLNYPIREGLNSFSF